jgi:cell wall-associated NlpC family hydrolase
VNTIPVDRAELVRLMKLCFSFRTYVSTIKYLLGAKPRMGAIPGAGFSKADCSGFVRWLIHGATHSEVTMPDGSWHQQQWAIKKRFRKVPYDHCGLHDSRLRIAFIRAKRGKVGHVWLTINGMTIESCGGRGATRRPWDTPALLHNVDSCYVLTEVM